MVQKCFFEKGEPAYELARAIWMVEHDAPSKAFDRASAMIRNARCERARKIIQNMEKSSGFTVMHKDDIDGG
jgi:hypothetical protein